MIPKSQVRVVMRFRPINDAERECQHIDNDNSWIRYDATTVDVADRSTSSGVSGSIYDSKPFGSASIGINSENNRRVTPTTALIRFPPKHFTFDAVIHELATQEMVYETVGRPVLENVLKGYNGTILAYGPTGSGKTHSVIGPSNDALSAFDPRGSHYNTRGIVPRTVEDLFAALKRFGSAERTWRIAASVFEIYKEDIHDLIENEPQQTDSRIRESTPSGPGVYVHSLNLMDCQSAEKLLDALHTVFLRRQTATTDVNEDSSRSHCIISLYLEQQDHATGGIVTSSRLNIVDLAGSERVSKTLDDVKNLKEAQAINYSLTLLGSSIYRLTGGKERHMPYRDSLLTRVLADSLVGDSLITLLCHGSISTLNLDETLSTLRFAARVKRVRNKPRSHREFVSQELRVRHARALEQIQQLEEQLRMQKDLLAVQESAEVIERMRSMISCLTSESDELKREVCVKDEELRRQRELVEYYKNHYPIEAEAAENARQIESRLRKTLRVMKAERHSLIEELRLAQERNQVLEPQWNPLDVPLVSSINSYVTLRSASAQTLNVRNVNRTHQPDSKNQIDIRDTTKRSRPRSSKCSEAFIEESLLSRPMSSERTMMVVSCSPASYRERTVPLGKDNGCFFVVEETAENEATQWQNKNTMMELTKEELCPDFSAIQRQHGRSKEKNMIEVHDGQKGDGDTDDDDDDDDEQVNCEPVLDTDNDHLRTTLCVVTNALLNATRDDFLPEAVLSAFEQQCSSAVTGREGAESIITLEALFLALQASRDALQSDEAPRAVSTLRGFIGLVGRSCRFDGSTSAVLTRLAEEDIRAALDVVLAPKSIAERDKAVVTLCEVLDDTMSMMNIESLASLRGRLPGNLSTSEILFACRAVATQLRFAATKKDTMLAIRHQETSDALIVLHNILEVAQSPCLAERSSSTSRPLSGLCGDTLKQALCKLMAHAELVCNETDKKLCAEYSGEELSEALRTMESALAVAKGSESPEAVEEETNRTSMQRSLAVVAAYASALNSSFAPSLRTSAVLHSFHVIARTLHNRAGERTGPNERTATLEENTASRISATENDLKIHEKNKQIDKERKKNNPDIDSSSSKGATMVKSIKSMSMLTVVSGFEEPSHKYEDTEQSPEPAEVVCVDRCLEKVESRTPSTQPRLTEPTCREGSYEVSTNAAAMAVEPKSACLSPLKRRLVTVEEKAVQNEAYSDELEVFREMFLNLRKTFHGEDATVINEQEAMELFAIVTATREELAYYKNVKEPTLQDEVSRLRRDLTKSKALLAHVQELMHRHPCENLEPTCGVSTGNTNETQNSSNMPRALRGLVSSRSRLECNMPLRHRSSTSLKDNTQLTENSVVSVDEVSEEDLTKCFFAWVSKITRTKGHYEEMMARACRLEEVLNSVNASRGAQVRDLDSLMEALTKMRDENAAMRNVLNYLNVDLEKYLAKLSQQCAANVLLQTEADTLKGTAADLRRTAGQAEFCEMVTTELRLKSSDFEMIKNQIMQLHTIHDKNLLERKRRVLNSALCQLAKYAVKILAMLEQHRRFNTGTLESHRLMLLDDAKSLMKEVNGAKEELQCI